MMREDTGRTITEMCSRARARGTAIRASLGMDSTRRPRSDIGPYPGALLEDLEAEGISLDGKTQHEKLDALLRWVA